MNLQEHLAALHCEKHVGCLECAKEVRADAFAFIREAVEGLRKPIKDWTKDEHGKKCLDGCTYCCYAQGKNEGFNSSLDAVLEILK